MFKMKYMYLPFKTFIGTEHSQTERDRGRSLSKLLDRLVRPEHVHGVEGQLYVREPLVHPLQGGGELEESNNEQGEDEEDVGSDDSEVEDPEPAPSPKKKSKKSKKLKTKEMGNENGTQNVNDASPVTSLPDQKKKKKKKKSKEKKVTVDEDAQSTDFVDNGDIVEDIVLSD